MYKRSMVLVLALMACSPERIPVDEAPILDMDRTIPDMVKVRAEPRSLCGAPCGSGKTCCMHDSGSPEFPIYSCDATQTYASCGSCAKTEACNPNFPDCCPSVDRLGGPGCTNKGGDPSNCGECGVRCGENEVCVDGACEVLP